MGLRKCLDCHDTTRLGIGTLKVHFLVKFTKMSLVNPRLTESQMRSKSTQNIIFHAFTTNSSHLKILSILTKFDPTLIPKGTRNPNFDSTDETCWDQFHYKYYLIPFPTTFHGSKSELKWLRYPENRAKRISKFLEAITFDLATGYQFL